MVPSFLTLALDGGELSALRSGCFISEETAPGTHPGEPRSSSGCCEEKKSLDPAGNRTPAVQSAGRRHTE
jgi:hypothetical protein